MPHPFAPPVSTMVQLLRHRATHQPDRVAYSFLVDGEDELREWTWAELDRRARAVAAWLQGRASPGSRALLMFEEGLDYLAALYGCMYAGVLAVPVHPPDPARLHRTLPRLRAICASADVETVLTGARLRQAAEPALRDVPELQRAEWLAVDAFDGDPDAWSDPDAGPDDIAYLQYTSGSTSTPRGVRISHRNLLHQLADFDTGYGHTPDSVLVSWLPATHDLGLVYGRFMGAFIGLRTVFMSPVAFMQRPARWLAAISRYRGTHSPSPNFGFELVVHKSTPDDLAGLDLSSLLVVLNGAEPIRQRSEQRFVEALRPFGLRPEAVTHAMGMSEATAKIVTEPIDRCPPRFVHVDPAALERNLVVQVPENTPGARAVASCGRTVLDTRVVIADPDSRERLPEGRVGELWVAGTTVAQGYHGDPEATEATFRAVLSDGDGPFLRTGDLGFVLDGELYLTGRLKDVVIIRGQNHHPQDIEWSLLEAHRALRPGCAAVFGLPVGDDEGIAVVTEVHPDRIDDPERVFGAIRAAVAEHGLQPAAIGLLPPRALPKTTSGKLQRSLARTLWQRGELPLVARWDAAPVESRPAPETDTLRARLAAASGRRREALLADHLASLAAGLLGLDPDDIDLDRPLQELGLDSVAAVEMVEQAGRAIGETVDGTVLFDHPTIDALAAWLADRL